MTKRIVIKNGTITGFADDIETLGIKVKNAKQKRVSIIVPQNDILRWLFTQVRAHVSDSSLVASMSRMVPCKWVAVIDGNESAPFNSRHAAIEYEKQIIYKQGKLHRPIESVNEAKHN
ncbi:hypothetical protein FWP33_13195 [Vibrio parahaemolyticus]|jgi:hypothetical protein|uniref:Uncharacterized protein n=1 Tax=Vibrio parahaemolyticus TaxID=670 RepID=A0A9Q3U828_VIBPH|nr:hypothetical protein [Vibrio parahaemolyticus]EGQ9743463.1 hypothetical protein [Vibrio parahaemolyticus]MCC3803943.1 hypothetical protein [Vibrio parahaemolyticus]